jgi:hypothetical protein
MATEWPSPRTGASAPNQGFTASTEFARSKSRMVSIFVIGTWITLAAADAARPNARVLTMVRGKPGHQ